MGLKQDVVIVNEFSVPLPNSSKKSGKGKKGSRGGTPGEYVTRYMAREQATEPLAPIRRDNADVFIQRYMARASATESLEVTSRSQLKGRMAEAQGSGGVAFGYGHISLSHEQLLEASADIQRLFDAGHTVMKTVISFDQEYLRKHKIIPEDFVCEKRGDYRGQIDQMKLRLAIMNGVNRMGRHLYDDLRYVAVIQVDTDHVHCHLAMADAGRGTLASDGTQRGKISAKARSLLRRGLDSWLDEKQTVAHLTSAVGYERRNVTTFVKRWAHQQMLRESMPQFLLACLPADRRLWRSGTNDPSMRKPNRLVKQIVQEVLDREGSPMNQAMAEVQTYANHRRSNESLSQAEWTKLVHNGEAKILERGVNAVYGLLRQLPDDALTVRTPMLDAMALDYEELGRRAHVSTADDALERFGFRLRSFSTRLDHHNEQRELFHERVRAWEAADDIGRASAASRAVYEYYLEEEEYHAKVASKYRKFLAFTPATDSWYSEWNKVAEYGERVISLESMRRDQSLRKLKDENEAERLGREIYGQSGGRLVARGGSDAAKALEERVRKMRSSYVIRVDDLRVKLASQGLRLQLTGDPATGRDTASVQAGPEFRFEEVKGLDLHHMRFDFTKDVQVGKRTLATFTSAAARRAIKADAAIAYLEASGQEAEIESLPLQDIRAMTKLAAQINAGQTHVLPSEVAALSRRSPQPKRSRTVRLGADLSTEVTKEVERITSTSFPVNEQERDISR